MDLNDKNLLELVEDSLNESNEYTAIIWRNVLKLDEKVFSYKQLNASANGFAKFLSGLGVKEKSFVAFNPFQSASYCLPAIIIGILKLGCSFVPLSQRREHLSRLPIDWLVTDDEISDGQCTAAYEIFSCPVSIQKITSAGQQFTHIEDSKIAYTITTSGTTGTPKVVTVPHKAIVPNIIYFRERFEVNQTDVIFQSAPSTFDPFVVEMFLAFSTGASLLMVPSSIKSRPVLLSQSLFQHPQPTVIQATPSLIRSLGSSNIKKLLLASSLKILAFGGEPFPMIEFQKWKETLHLAKIFNIYGVTEVSCWSACQQVNPHLFESISLGEPLPFNKLQVRSLLDGRILTQGAGQLFITTGNRMCLIDGKSMKDKWHATGDIVHLKEDGTITYKSRLGESRTLKRSGQKISLLKIENAARRILCVENCCAMSNVTENLKIVLFVSSSENLQHKNLELNILVELQRLLPPVSVPDAVIAVKCFPLTEHGKVDQRRLACICRKWVKKAGSKSCLHTAKYLERVIREAWIVSLGLHVEVEIGQESYFMMVGGDSARAALFYNQLLLKMGFSEAYPELLTAVLEKSFANICNTLKGMKQRIGKTDCEVAHEAHNSGAIIQQLETSQPQFMSGKFEPDQNAPKIVFHASKGQISVLKSEMLDPFESSSPFSLKTGWKIDFGKCIDASPLLIGFESERLVCVGSHSGKFATIDVETGKELWSLHLADRIEATATVCNHGHLLFVGCYDGCMYCFDLHRGQIVWIFQTGAMVKSSAVIYNESLIFGSYDQSIYCLSQKTGSILWKTDLNSGSILATPCLVGNILVVATLKGALVGINADDGTQLWKTINQGKPYFASPLQISNYVIVIGDVSGLVSFVDVSKGCTNHSLQIDSDLFASFSKFDANLIFSTKNKLLCFDYKKFKTVWTLDLNCRITSTPFVSKSILTVACSDNIFVIDLKTQKIKSHFSFSKEVFSSPVMYANKILLGCRDNFFYSLLIT